MSFNLTDQEGEFLIRLARHAVMQYLETGKTIKPPKETPKNLLKQHGVFVTINSIKYGERELRGCIGYPYPTTPIAKAVIDSAINASTQDPRFDPVSAEELEKILFEVSVLSPPESVEESNPKEYASKIKVGEDGLIVERGYRKGLLLPQVPMEWGWNEEEFLCQCCMKAGLQPDSWLTKDVKISKFKAIIFIEETPEGKIKRLHLPSSLNLGSTR